MRHRADPPAPDADPRRRVRLGVGAAVVLLLAAFVIAVLASLGAQQGDSIDLASTGTATPSPSDSGRAPGPEVFVHVSGAVTTPGLVTLQAGARVVDAIAAAGGLTAEAEPAGVNLARLVSDGEQLVVPKAGEVPAASAGSAGTGGVGGVGGLVNVNTAGQLELESLPRIGPALAQRILEWREANGRFAAVTDLRNVAGIGEKIYDGLKDRVTV